MRKGISAGPSLVGPASVQFSPAHCGSAPPWSARLLMGLAIFLKLCPYSRASWRLGSFARTRIRPHRGAGEKNRFPVPTVEPAPTWSRSPRGVGRAPAVTVANVEPGTFHEAELGFAGSPKEFQGAEPGFAGSPKEFNGAEPGFAGSPMEFH